MSSPIKTFICLTFFHLMCVNLQVSNFVIVLLYCYPLRIILKTKYYDILILGGQLPARTLHYRSIRRAVLQFYARPTISP